MAYTAVAETYTKDFKAYVDELKKMDPEKAKVRAQKSLEEAGLLDENGHVKQNIVNGDFFGWGERNAQ